MASYARNRSRRGRKIRAQQLGLARPAIAAGVQLTENPNSGKRHAAHLEHEIRTSGPTQPLTMLRPARDIRGRRIPRAGMWAQVNEAGRPTRDEGSGAYR